MTLFGAQSTASTPRDTSENEKEAENGEDKYDSEPVLSRDYLEYDGKFYVIGEGYKGFVADKQSDEDNYILTLAAIAKELEAIISSK